ncbi:MAG: hypothetical protein JWO98_5409 [Frankiales bacterium]|nr:hypothetical protein [Frankiales bacterium]
MRFSQNGVFECPGRGTLFPKRLRGNEEVIIKRSVSAQAIWHQARSIPDGNGAGESEIECPFKPETCVMIVEIAAL